MRPSTAWLVSVAAACCPALAGVTEFRFANVGGSFSAALFAGSPLVGQEVLSTRIVLDVRVDPGSDAADFITEILLPIDPFPGNDNHLLLEGRDLGWSGSGLFHFEETTDRFNGLFIARRYGGSTPTQNFSGQILPGSGVFIDHVPAPSAGAVLGLAGLAALRRRR